MLEVITVGEGMKAAGRRDAAGVGRERRQWRWLAEGVRQGEVRVVGVGCCGEK